MGRAPGGRGEDETPTPRRSSVSAGASTGRGRLYASAWRSRSFLPAQMPSGTVTAAAATP